MDFRIEPRLVLHTGDSPVKKGSEGTTQLAGLRAMHVEHANPFLERALRLQLVREGDELQMNSLIGYLNQIRAKPSKQPHKEAQRTSSAQSVAPQLASTMT